jgi:hypothetical protein
VCSRIFRAFLAFCLAFSRFLPRFSRFLSLSASLFLAFSRFLARFFSLFASLSASLFIAFASPYLAFPRFLPPRFFSLFSLFASLFLAFLAFCLAFSRFSRFLPRFFSRETVPPPHQSWGGFLPDLGVAFCPQGLLRLGGLGHRSLVRTRATGGVGPGRASARVRLLESVPTVDPKLASTFANPQPLSPKLASWRVASRMARLAWLRRNYVEQRVRGRALEEALAALAAKRVRWPTTVTMRGPGGGWVPVGGAEDDWVEEALGWAKEQAGLVQAALAGCRKRFRILEGRLFTQAGESLDLALASDTAPQSEAKVLTEVTYSRRPQEADDAGREKLRKYFLSRAELHASHRVGLVAVGDNRLWVSTFDAPCAQPSEMDASFHESIELRARCKDSGFANRESGASSWAVEERWRRNNRKKCLKYKQDSQAKAVKKTGIKKKKK